MNTFENSSFVQEEINQNSDNLDTTEFSKDILDLKKNVQLTEDIENHKADLLLSRLWIVYDLTTKQISLDKKSPKYIKTKRILTKYYTMDEEGANELLIECGHFIMNTSVVLEDETTINPILAPDQAGRYTHKDRQITLKKRNTKRSGTQHEIRHALQYFFSDKGISGEVIYHLVIPQNHSFYDIQKEFCFQHYDTFINHRAKELRQGNQEKRIQDEELYKLKTLSDQTKILDITNTYWTYYNKFSEELKSSDPNPNKIKRILSQWSRVYRKNPHTELYLKILGDKSILLSLPEQDKSLQEYKTWLTTYENTKNITRKYGNKTKQVTGKIVLGLVNKILEPLQTQEIEDIRTDPELLYKELYEERFDEFDTRLSNILNHIEKTYNKVSISTIQTFLNNTDIYHGELTPLLKRYLKKYPEDAVLWIQNGIADNSKINEGSSTA